jgi:hypothetical protein
MSQRGNFLIVITTLVSPIILIGPMGIVIGIHRVASIIIWRTIWRTSTAIIINVHSFHPFCYAGTRR